MITLSCSRDSKDSIKKMEIAVALVTLNIYIVQGSILREGPYVGYKYRSINSTVMQLGSSAVTPTVAPSSEETILDKITREYHQSQKVQEQYQTGKLEDVDHTSRTLELIVKSGKLSALLYTNFSTFRINDFEPDIEDAEVNNAGLYVIVLHQVTGRPVSNSFNLQPWADLNLLQPFLSSLQPGRIVVFLLRKHLSYGIPKEIREFLQRKGSAAAGFLGTGMTWIWVWVNGGRTIAESVTLPDREEIAPRHLLNLQIPLSEHTDYCPLWPRERRWELRKRFCDKYEQYGDFCSCSDPDLLSIQPEGISNSQIVNAVVVMLAHRVPALYRSLKFLSSAKGFNPSRFETYTMSPRPELASFLEIVDLPLTVTHQSHEMLSTAIARHLLFALRHALRSHPDADFIVVMEEDVAVSPDFFVFLNRTASLLTQDPSLYCVSAHNDLSYPQTSYDGKAVLRTESYPNYGWMVQRSFAEDMVSSMANIDQEFDWDVVTYFYLRKGRECIIPEVSRSFHFAHEGSHISQLSVRKYFSHKLFNLDPEATVEGVDLLSKDKYEATITSLLERAKFLRLPQDTPCQKDFFSRIRVKEDDVLVLFFQLDENLAAFRNNGVWETLALCLHIFAIESRESHKGLYRLRYGPANFLLVAYPASPYSRFKPEDVNVFTATPEERIFAHDKTTFLEEPYRFNISLNGFLET